MSVEGGPDEQPKQRELDPRWLDAAIGAEALDLACVLARPGHAGVMKFLPEQIKDANPHETYGIVQAMVRIGFAGAGDAIVDAVKKEAKASRHGYTFSWYPPMIEKLPASDSPKFEALLPTLPEKMVDQLMESVLALKDKAQQATQ